MYIFNFLLNIKINKKLFYSDKIYIIYLKLLSFFYYALFFDRLYNLIYLNTLNYSYLITAKYIDKGFLEFFGPFGIYKLFRNISLSLQNIIPQLLFYYLFIFFLSLFIFTFIIVIVFIFDINILNNNLTLLFILIIIYYLSLWDK
jgi:hypothetical protein